MIINAIPSVFNGEFHLISVNFLSTFLGKLDHKRVDLLNKFSGNVFLYDYISQFCWYLLTQESEHVKTILKASDFTLMTLGKEAFGRLRKDLQEICVIIGKYLNSTFEQIRKYLSQIVKSEIPKSTISPKINELQKLGYINIDRIGREKRCFLKSFLQKYYNQIIHE